MLKEWPTSIADRQAYVDPIFATIARRYDLMGRVLSLGLGQAWKKKSVALISGNEPQSILDLACGTGDFPIHLRRAGFTAPIVGLDRNAAMLEVARAKCSRFPRIALLRGDLMRICFKDESFDVVTIGYGLRYPADVRKILAEAFRLLRSGGIFVAMDFGVPKNALYRRVCFGYLLCFGSLLGLALHRKVDTYWHIVESLKVYPGQEAVKNWLGESGFIGIRMRELLGGIIVIHCGIRP